MKETADAIIVGGGVIGTSIAYHLAQKQFGHIILLERDSLGSGSTGHSVATIDFLTLQEHAVELYARSAVFFQNSAEILGTDCGFVETGSILLGGPEQEQKLSTAVYNMQEAKLDVRSLTLGELEALDPRMVINGVTTASYTPQAGYADPAMTTYAFAKASQSLGVDIQQGCEVLKLLSECDRIIGVETTTGKVTSPLIIIAAGPWSMHILRSVGIDLPLYVISHPVVALRRQPDFGPAHPALLDLTTGIYARPETGGLTLLGSLDPQIGHDQVDPNRGPGYVHENYILWTMERLVQRYPMLATSELHQGWSGLMTISPDWQPVIGQCPDWRGLYCAIGFSGLGFQISPATGELLSGLLCGENSATKQLAPYSPARFAAGQLLPTYRDDITDKSSG